MEFAKQAWWGVTRKHTVNLVNTQLLYTHEIRMNKTCMVGCYQETYSKPSQHTTVIYTLRSINKVCMVGCYQETYSKPSQHTTVIYTLRRMNKACMVGCYQNTYSKPSQHTTAIYTGIGNIQMELG